MLTAFMMGSPLSDFITEKSPSLEDILDHEALLCEYKKTNPQLTKFLSYDKYSELLDYLIVVGPPEDQKRSYKFPFIVCEMLCTPNPQFLNFTLPDQPIFIESTVIETKEVEVEVEVSDSDPEENAEEEGLKQSTTSADKETQIEAEGTVKLRARTNSMVKIQLSDSDEEEFGEFVKPKKRVKMRQVQEVPRILRREVPSLLHKLFSYFEGQLNYILSSYVCKVLLALIVERPVKMFTFLLNPIQVSAMLRHISSRSVHDVLVRICTIESTDFLPQRKIVYDLLLHAIKSQHEDSVSECVLEILTKVTGTFKSPTPILAYLETFIQPEQFQVIADNVLNEGWARSVSIFKIYLGACTNMPVIKSFLEKVPSRLAQKHKTIHLIEPVALLAKRSSNMRSKILMSGVLPFLLPLLPQHPFNNLLQNEISTIMEQCLADRAIAANCISETALLPFLLNEQKEQSTFAGKNCRKGYIGHLIKWIRIISQSNYLSDVAAGNQFITVLSYFQSHIDKQKQQLGGYQRKQSRSSNILFSRESVLLQHSIFLAQVPIRSEEDLMAEMQKQLDQYELQQKDMLQSRQIEDEANENYEKIFKVHLEYEIDDLMLEID